MEHNGPHGEPKPVAGLRAIFAVFVFVTIGFLACATPDYPEGFHLSTFFRLPLEVPITALVLLLAPWPAARVVAAVATMTVFCLLLLKLADVGVLSAFQRRFNPYLDIKMVFDGWNVLSGAMGKAQAAAITGAILLALVTLLSVFCWASLQLGRFGRASRWAAVSGFATVTLPGAGWLVVGHGAMPPNVVELQVVPYLGERLSLVSRSIADIRAFERTLTVGTRDPDGVDLFGGIKGRDVILVFVESYGRSAIDDPRHGDLIKPRLDTIERQLQSTGFAAASAWTRSPTVGGLSWLAHGTLLSGLWVDSQARYDLLMASDRPSLNHLFHSAGWHTVAVMPAITMDWPEAAYYGYDTILAAKDLGYHGKPFNWVTMPDQYTLSAFERLVRTPTRNAGKSVMAEIALISSHAPWTPVPRLVDWAAVGNGTIFNDQAESGDSPAVVWADQNRVRRQYAQTVDYALQTLADYIARFGEDAVFIILGDHQPAALITGPEASRAVPVHIISRDLPLIEGFRRDGFSPGMTPDALAPEGSMDALRDRLITRFSAR